MNRSRTFLAAAFIILATLTVAGFYASEKRQQERFSSVNDRLANERTEAKKLEQKFLTSVNQTRALYKQVKRAGKKPVVAPAQIPSVGLPGDDGSAGSSGPQGPPGASGQDGLNGLLGLPGTNGTNGGTGASGANGTNGTNGVDGKDGSTGPPGPPGPPGQDGKDGKNGDPGPQGDPGFPNSFTFEYETTLGQTVTRTCTDPDGDHQYSCV